MGKPDEGSGIVLLELTEYLVKMNEIIIDSVTSSSINFLRNPNAKVNSSGGPFWAQGTEAFLKQNTPFWKNIPYLKNT